MDLQPIPFPDRRPSAWADEADPSYRVGDLERAAACDALADHYAAGRLDPAELDDRLARAMAARTRAELRAPFADLAPRRPVPEVPPEGPVRTHPPSGGTLPLVVAVLVLSVLLAGGMLLALGAYSAALFVAALVGGTATAVAGSCVTTIWRSMTTRR